jgi:hypothetical protein
VKINGKYKLSFWWLSNQGVKMIYQAEGGNEKALESFLKWIKSDIKLKFFKEAEENKIKKAEKAKGFATKVLTAAKILPVDFKGQIKKFAIEFEDGSKENFYFGWDASDDIKKKFVRVRKVDDELIKWLASNYDKTFFYD